jgi:predicted alpha/beta superfamily hydrolase
MVQIETNIMQWFSIRLGLLLLATQSLNSQTATLTRVENSGIGQIISIQSRYVKDETFCIQIYLPTGYDTSSTKFPVLYLFDGDRSFGMARDIIEWLQNDGEIKNVILIGIGYGTQVDDRDKRQMRDFTPSRDPALKTPLYINAGGAKNFLLFIQKELIPTIEARYPVNNQKVFIGFDYGGLFGAYTLLSSSKTFTDYIFVAPYLLWDNRYIFKIENAYSMLYKDMEANVLIIYGLFDSGENYILPSDEFAEQLRNRKYPGLSIAVRQYDAETHSSVYPIALQYCIKTFFKK